jgi:hypothetical protein
MGLDNDNSESNSKNVETDYNVLIDLENKFNNKRKEYPPRFKTRQSIAIVATGFGIFTFSFIFIIGLSSLETLTNVASSLTSKEFLNNEFASSISLSVSLALIPIIIYSIARLVKTQQLNAELSTLNQEIRTVRGRIIEKNQAQSFTLKNEQLPRLISSDIELMHSTLKEMLIANQLVLYPGTLTKIAALNDRYDDYEENIRYKYANLLGNEFSPVDAAIFGFLNIARQLSRITSQYIMKKEMYTDYRIDLNDIQRTIEILNKAIDALKSHESDTIDSSKK